ncbi:hypothetical protein GQ53DRAFT_817528 [Thozetella sp. PMI_491]|nr:hypothetical protein GQ53DRAFT_817528 [Thozetella sp. PMI_491]
MQFSSQIAATFMGMLAVTQVLSPYITALTLGGSCKTYAQADCVGLLFNINGPELAKLAFAVKSFRC